MIFVTVGTHEQQFNRLIKEIDDLKKNGYIEDNVFIQTGYSTYEPTCCEWKDFLSYPEMNEMMSRARIIITHGGPSSFMKPLQLGKVPIVVPRREKYHEHVNDHQLEFATAERDRYKNIIVVKDEHDLKNVLNEYDDIVSKMRANVLNNNAHFCKLFEKIANKLVTKDEE